MPIVGFRFRAYADEQTLRALKAQLRLASEVYNTLRWARQGGEAGSLALKGGVVHQIYF